MDYKIYKNRAFCDEIKPLNDRLFEEIKCAFTNMATRTPVSPSLLMYQKKIGQRDWRGVHVPEIIKNIISPARRWNWHTKRGSFFSIFKLLSQRTSRKNIFSSLNSEIMVLLRSLRQISCCSFAMRSTIVTNMH